MSNSGKEINWEEVKARMEESQAALDRSFTAGQEGAEAVYEKRAAQLARRRVQNDAPALSLRVLVFLLGGELYGLDFRDLVEMLPFVNCTRVPGGPPQLLGVINVHGEIRSVVDLGRIMEIPEGAAPGSGYVLLVRNQGRQVGLRVDSLNKIQQIALEDLAVPANGDSGPSIRYLKGLTRDRLRVLSTEAIFSHPLFHAGG